MSKICNSCTTENVDEAKFCRKCGNPNFQTQEDIPGVEKTDTSFTVHPDYIHYCEFMKKIGVKGN